MAMKQAKGGSKHGEGDVLSPLTEGKPSKEAGPENNFGLPRVDVKDPLGFIPGGK